MGNIQNLVCQDNNFFDNNYEFDWISNQTWFIDTQCISKKNNYTIEKGLFKILSKSKCIYFLSKCIQNNQIDNLLFHLKINYQLINEQVDFIFYLSQKKVNSIFEKPSQYIISKIIIKNNQLFYVNDKDHLIKIKKHDENHKNKLNYKITFDFKYIEYLIVNEIYDNHQESKNMFEMNKDLFYLNIYIQSSVQKKDNYVHFRI